MSLLHLKNVEWFLVPCLQGKVQSHHGIPQERSHWTEPGMNTCTESSYSLHCLISSPSRDKLMHSTSFCITARLKRASLFSIDGYSHLSKALQLTSVARACDKCSCTGSCGLTLCSCCPEILNTFIFEFVFCQWCLLGLQSTRPGLVASAHRGSRLPTVSLGSIH